MHKIHPIKIIQQQFLPPLQIINIEILILNVLMNLYYEHYFTYRYFVHVQCIYNMSNYIISKYLRFLLFVNPPFCVLLSVYSHSAVLSFPSMTLTVQQQY